MLCSVSLNGDADGGTKSSKSPEAGSGPNYAGLNGISKEQAPKDDWLNILFAFTRHPY
jgi:hypothetical protein